MQGLDKFYIPLYNKYMNKKIMKTKKYIVYKVENIKNGKLYIGRASQTLREVKSHHKRSAIRNVSNRFNQAIRKWGWDSFVWYYMGTYLTLKEANGMQGYLIRVLDTTNENKGYNVNFRNVSDKGYRISDKIRREKYKDKSNIVKRVFTDEHKNNLRLSHLGNVSGFKGKKHTEQTIIKIKKAKAEALRKSKSK